MKDLLSKKSRYLTLNWRDLLRGLFVTVLFSVGSTITEMIKIKGFNIDFILVIRYATVSISSYLLNALVTNKNGQYFKPEKQNDS